MALQAKAYRKLVLAERRGDVEVFGDHDVAEVLSETDAPNREPIDVADGQIARQLNLNVLALVASQFLRPGDVTTVNRCAGGTGQDGGGSYSPSSLGTFMPCGLGSGPVPTQK